MKVYISTVGCKLNQFESEAIAEQLHDKGYTIVSDMEESDTVVVNTCTVTARADTKCRQIMRKAKNHGKYVVATGCYATTDFESLRKSDFVDLVVNNDNKFELASFLEHTKPVNTLNSFPLVSSFERTRAFIKIQDGCNQFCSYCKVPFARGRSKSFQAKQVTDMAKKLVSHGYKEIVLTGVNISDYHDENTGLAGLVGMILALDGDFRLRLSSLQPDKFENRLLDFIGHPKFANHFHLSLQSGSQTVLKRMNRHYSPDNFTKLCETIRSKDPSCGISTDIIVGFPEESDKEFLETLNLVEKNSFSRVHIFPYSPREGTRAALMPDMDKKIKKERVKMLADTARKNAIAFAEKHLIGSEERVLIETQHEKLWNGYTSNYIRFNSRKSGLRENEFALIKAKSFTVSRDAVIDLFD